VGHSGANHPPSHALAGPDHHPLGTWGGRAPARVPYSFTLTAVAAAVVCRAACASQPPPPFSMLGSLGHVP
jgi:hypothetical protein